MRRRHKIGRSKKCPKREMDCERTAINLQSIKYDYGKCEEEWLSAEVEERTGKAKGEGNYPPE